MKRKKGFTLVELLVVIAILAILATVSILGYTSFTKKANYSNDTTLLTEWNRSLDGKDVLADSDINEKLNNVIEVKKYFSSNGTGEDTFTPKSNGYHFYWCESDNNIYLVDDSNGFTVKYPESTTVTAANSYRLDKEYYSVTCSIEGITIDKKLVAEGETNVEITLTATDVDMPNKVKIGDTEYTVSSNKITVKSIASNIVISESNGSGSTSYTVTFDKQDGTGGTNSVNATNGQAMPTVKAPTRTGYIFNGYYSAENGGGTKYYNADETSAKNYDLTTDTTLYAYWSKLGYFLDANNALIGDYFTVEAAGLDASLVKNITGYSSAHTVVLPDGITSIADNAFGGQFGSVSFKAVVIPSSVETIGDFAFGIDYGTNNLESVTFDTNSKLTSIGESAFGKAKFTTITIPATASIGQEAFCGCNSLTTVAFATDAVTSETKTTIGKSAFSTLSELTTITIPNCVTVIGDDAFTKCEKLECVLFEENSKLETIGQNAFSNCSSIKEIVLPDSVKYFVKTSQVENDTVNLDAVLESGAFADCTALESITIPSNTIVIGKAAFARCTNLKTITFAKGTDGSKLQKIDCIAFETCSSLEEIEIPKNVTFIEDSAFVECGNLKTVTFEAGSKLKRLDSCVFCKCISLTAIEIPEGCTTLKGKTSNQSSAFKDCTNLTSVTLPSTITVIGEHAFTNCSNLTTITYLGTVEEWNSIEFAGKDSWRDDAGISSITINGVAHTLVNDNEIQ